MRFKKLNQKGFTLIEMMLVLLVISILILLLLPSAQSYITEANKTGCDALTASYDALTKANSMMSTPAGLGNLEENMNTVCSR